MIVNDEPFQLLMIAQAIQNIQNVEVFTAANGDLALRQIQNNMVEFYDY